ncbi:hypothetical protein GCM10009841_36540 [Microlunatus panaciterrae]|uniref:Short-subunit dehydrogenase n=1 Tax=Microlunatus panaciterrae TaxID=400768 RepID=A0ABS2RH35_9ACTN|nr:SDR family NAD(P)-dependent oxidoreductase [Microlunatus panaciterrae]MBM7798313.1 short-subunit dehydrogenase [Microlunatus panaciterrae]
MGQVANAVYRAHLGPGWRAPAPARLAASMANTTVLVTGASSGIGEATARLLAAAGAEMLLVARRQDRLQALAAEIEAAGGRARALPCDLSDPVAVGELVDRLCTAPVAVDVVVSNAGKSIKRSLSASAGRFHDITRTNAVNYLGPIQLLMGLLPGMRQRRKGHVVNVSSVSAAIPFPLFSAYSGSKAGFEAWLRSIGPEIRADEVFTTSILFPLVHTDMSRSNYGRLPGLTPTAAAEVIAGALVRRPRLLCPWWARIADPVLTNAQGPFDRAAARMLGRR